MYADRAFVGTGLDLALLHNIHVVFCYVPDNILAVLYAVSYQPVSFKQTTDNVKPCIRKVL